MTGIVALVPLAELLVDMAGSRQGAVRLAAQIFDRGAQALPRGGSNIVYAAQRELVGTGVITGNGVPVPHRAAELVIVCEVLAAGTPPDPEPPTEQRLVFSAPAETVSIGDAERLDGLVLDVIRQATGTLHLGGAFWNPAGFERLGEVLLPALRVRAVSTVIYANPVAEQYNAGVLGHLHRLASAGRVSLQWFNGPRRTMLHAKFVIADRRIGYLGSANLTSWGLQGHIEAGVELTAGQAERFVVFLEQLETAGLFTETPARPAVFGQLMSGVVETDDGSY